MRPYLVIGILTLVCALTSCINSLNPLITYKNIIANDAIVGRWSGKGQEVQIGKFRGSEIEKFISEMDGKQKSKQDKWAKLPASERKMYSNSYIASYYVNGRKYYHFLSFTKINDDLFAQLQPIASFMLEKDHILNPADSSYKDVFTNEGKEGYVFAKTTLNGNNATFNFIDEGFFSNLFKSGAINIRHEEDRLFDASVITASSEELLKFIQKYGKDKRLYKEESSLHLTRIN